MKLGASINYRTNILEISGIKIPFYLEHVSKQINSQKINYKNHIKIPVTIENGDVIIPETKIGQNCFIPECLSVAKDGYCLLPFDETPEIDLNCTERIEVAPLLDDTTTDLKTKDKSFLNISQVIRTDHLNSEERHEVIQLCKKFRDIFYNENCDLSFTNAVKHEIRTTDDNPVYIKPYRHPYGMKQEIQEHIQKMLDNKIIRPSISPYSAPVWLVPKKVDASGKKKTRLILDFRSLNSKTVEDKYPIPRIEEILDNLGKCNYFTTLDLAQGFHQIEMHPNSIEKTAFTVNNGHYEYLRMPFGLKNAPSTFQRVMDNVLREYLHKFVFVYMDDIVIFSKSLQEHIIHIKQIFSKLRQFNLKVQLDKTEFMRKEVAFLGHIITPDGIKPNPSKIQAVLNYPIPKSTKEIKSFLGLVGYYRKFIPNFAKIVAPLTKCLRKGSKINIQDTDYIQAFELCKELLTNAPILAYPRFDHKFTLTTDASGVSIGGVLSQSDRPIAYYSRTLNSAERNYSTIERELLAILDSTKHFRPYLYGQIFTIETDHNPLVWLYKIKEPNSRLVRWKLKLEEFSFNIVYKSGKQNKVADALSRVELHNTENDDTDSIIAEIHETPDLTDVDMDRIIQSQVQDMQPVEQISNVDTIHSTDDDNGKVIPISEHPVNIFQNRVIISLGEQYKHRLTKPFNKNTYKITVRPNAIEEELTIFIKETFKPNSTYCIYFINEIIRRKFEQLCKQTFNNTIKIFISNILCRDVINIDEQHDVVQTYHNTNHNGIFETYNNLKIKYFWPNMKQTITNIINSCETCLQSKYERHPYKLKFSGPLLAKRPFEILHLDTFSFQSSKFLTIIDLFSRYGQAYLVPDGTGITILNKLRHYFAHHSIPQKIVCDEGREFQNNTFKEFCKINKIKLHFTTVNNPNSNSPIERFHSTILEKLRILRIKNNKEIPSNLMISAVLIYNQSIHSSTGFSPFYLLYGPYETVPEFDLSATIYEQYNEKRRREILPFYEQVYQKAKEKAQQNLNKRNDNRDDPPDIETKQIFIKRKKPGKTDPLYEKLNVVTQNDSKILGKTQKQRDTTAHLSKMKKLRQVFPLQNANPLDNPPDTPIDDDTIPGPSGLNHRK